MASNSPTSCTGCSARRIKCDGGRPACLTCGGEQRICSYDWTLGDHIFGLFPQNINLNGKFRLDMHAYHDDRGAFARVYRTKMSDGRAVAVKVFFENMRLPHRTLELSVREAWTWSQLGHRNIVPFLGLANYENVCTGALPQLCLVSPWMAAGNIMDYLKENHHVDRLLLAWDIAKGVEYLHTHEAGPVIHGDLKGNNILIDFHEGRPRACLTDFGLAHVMDSVRATMETTSTSDNGNARWLAFERMFPSKYGLEGLTDAKSTHSDVFEMMRTFLQIFTGKIPFHGLGDWDVFDRVRTATNPSAPRIVTGTGMSFDMWDLILRAWSTQRTARPSAGYVRASLEEWCICNVLEAPPLHLTQLRSIFECVSLPELSLDVLRVGPAGEVYERTRSQVLRTQHAHSTILQLHVDGLVHTADRDVLKKLTAVLRPSVWECLTLHTGYGYPLDFLLLSVPLLSYAPKLKRLFLWCQGWPKYLLSDRPDVSPAPIVHPLALVARNVPYSLAAWIGTSNLKSLEMRNAPDAGLVFDWLPILRTARRLKRLVVYYDCDHDGQAPSLFHSNRHPPLMVEPTLLSELSSLEFGDVSAETALWLAQRIEAPNLVSFAWKSIIPEDLSCAGVNLVAEHVCANWRALEEVTFHRWLDSSLSFGRFALCSLLDGLPALKTLELWDAFGVGSVKSLALEGMERLFCHPRLRTLRVSGIPDEDLISLLKTKAATGDRLKRLFIREEDMERMKRRPGDLWQQLEAVADEIGCFVVSHGLSLPP